MVMDLWYSEYLCECVNRRMTQHNKTRVSPLRSETFNIIAPLPLTEAQTHTSKRCLTTTPQNARRHHIELSQRGFRVCSFCVCVVYVYGLLPQRQRHRQYNVCVCLSVSAPSRVCLRFASPHTQAHRKCSCFRCAQRSNCLYALPPNTSPNHGSPHGIACWSRWGVRRWWTRRGRLAHDCLPKPVRVVLFSNTYYAICIMSIQRDTHIYCGTSGERRGRDLCSLFSLCARPYWPVLLARRPRLCLGCYRREHTINLPSLCI